MGAYRLGSAWMRVRNVGVLALLAVLGGTAPAAGLEPGPIVITLTGLGNDQNPAVRIGGPDCIGKPTVRVFAGIYEPFKKGQGNSIVGQASCGKKAVVSVGAVKDDGSGNMKSELSKEVQSPGAGVATCEATSKTLKALAVPLQLDSRWVVTCIFGNP